MKSIIKLALISFVLVMTMSSNAADNNQANVRKVGGEVTPYHYR